MRRWVAIAGLLLVGAAAPAATANAQQPPPTPPPPTPVQSLPTAAAPVDDDDDGPESRPGGSGNLLGFEEYGPYPLSRYTIGCDEGAWNHISRKFWCVAQQLPFEGTKLLVGLASSLINWAMNFGLAEGLTAAAGAMASSYNTRLVGGLRLEHLAWSVACAWAAWLLLRARTSQALGELATSCVVALLGSFIIANPAGYLEGAAATVRSANTAVMSALSGGDEGGHDVVADVGAQLHTSFVAEPYDVVNWGGSLDATPACAAARDEILAAGPYSAGSDAPRDAMRRAGCTDQADFNHDPGGDRALASVACLVAASLVLGLMCLLAATLLASQLMLVVLWALSPLAVIAGIAPGVRGVLWRWCSANLTVLLVNLACVFTLGFVTVMTTEVLAMTEDVSIVQRLGLVDLVVVTALVFRKRLVVAAHSTGHRVVGQLARLVPAQAGSAPMRPAPVGGISGYALGRQMNEALGEVPGGRRAQYIVERRLPAKARHAARAAGRVRHPRLGNGGPVGVPLTAHARRHAPPVATSGPGGRRRRG